MKFADQKRQGPIVVLGDSLAAGYELQDNEGFVALLSQRLGLDLVNLSVSGATTTDSLPRVAKEVLPLKPSLVIIELGGNDVLRKLDVAVTRENLQSMIDQIHATQTPVMILGVRGGVLSDKFADLFDSLAADNGLAYVPNILEGILTSPSLRVDNVHPNAEGHKVIADRVEPTLRALVEKMELSN